jgi:hypothetical protein
MAFREAVLESDIAALSITESSQLMAKNGEVPA